ncbi:MAG: hypothetical protein HF314_17670 [Ignavibacteria bacterium]|nr:hypothetical protein [Ignavibacteria bacterium]MCU7504916.1 hypothetical protein [Ignavibacteria bacterium]MCU7517792.1 hypothetical protein [Ignavibacteria bacterium]
MKYALRFTAFLLFSSIIITTTKAQSLEETLSRLSNNAARAYLDPASSGFGANLNTGWTTRAPQAKLFGVDIQFGVVAMGAMFKNDNKTFSFTGDYTFTAEQALQMTQNITNPQIRNQIMNKLTSDNFQVGFSGATIAGKKSDHIKIGFEGKKYSINGEEFNVPAQQIDLGVGGVLDDMTMLPLGAPQLTIGTVYGTQVALRYLPSLTFSEELGKAKYFGFGIQHNIGQWIPVPMPVNLSAGFFTQKLKVGDILESSATEYGLYASKTFGPGALNVTPYAGFSLQNSTMTVNYDYEYTVRDASGRESSHSSKVSFDLDGENTTKLTVGVAFKLAFLNLNVDYNVAKFSTIGAGVGFIF